MEYIEIDGDYYYYHVEGLDLYVFDMDGNCSSTCTLKGGRVVLGGVRLDIVLYIKEDIILK